MDCTLQNHLYIVLLHQQKLLSVPALPAQGGCESITFATAGTSHTEVCLRRELELHGAAL